MSETKVVYWRHDAGQMSASNIPIIGAAPSTRLVHGDYYYTSFGVAPDHPGTASHFLDATHCKTPYGGNQINRSAMQISAAINLFGIEDVPFIESSAGTPATFRNESVGKRWVIKPKFETPMLNFNDTGARPLTNSAGPAAPTAASPTYLSIPTNMSASVPRGMWHQFGIIEPDPAKGIFLEIANIPNDWMSKHYLTINTASVYNKWNPRLDNATGEINIPDNSNLSLCNLLGFGATPTLPNTQKSRSRHTIHSASRWGSFRSD